MTPREIADLVVPNLQLSVEWEEWSSGRALYSHARGTRFKTS